MGWKGVLRDVSAGIRAVEREAQRRQRELEKERKQQLKMAELERAANEVDVYNNYIDVLLSVYKTCSSPIDWQKIRAAKPPTKPTRSNTREKLAQEKLDKYKPGITDKLMKREEKRRGELAETVGSARQQDEEEYQKNFNQYQREYSEWEETQNQTEKVLSGDPDALVEVIKELNPLMEISELGSSIDFQGHQEHVMEALLHIKGEEVVPKKVKALLKSGKLSVKEMPKAQFWELYQDFVCGCVLRVARELFALLPLRTVLITALGNLLDTKTGHIEETPILSAFIPKDTIVKLNFQALDPSDAMTNFVHRMNFKKTTGFNPVEKLEITDLQLPR